MAASRLDRITTAPAWHLDGDNLNQDIFDALAGLCPQLLKWAATIASQHALPLSCVKAVQLLGTPLSMKELARRMHCDPSFVTVTADMLEERGLAKRESDATDRRIRNLVLTPRGHDLRQRLEQALLGQMPWDTALSVAERHSFLALLRKVGDPDRPVAANVRDVADAGEGPGRER